MPNTHKLFPFPIEAGQVQAFNRAIGYPPGSELVPPTYVTAADHFDPLFERRPKPGEAWLETPIESLFHVEQTITYHAPLRVGMQCSARRRDGRRWQKQGRTAGKLEFVETITDILGTDKELLLSSSWVDVITQQTHASLTRSQDSGSEPSNGQSPGGDSITPTQIVMYVGAAGDFHPLHHDDAYAREQGYPSIFAPGMLTMALAGRAITERIGQENLRCFGGRFRAQVWPGDELKTEVTVATADSNKLNSLTTNQHGTTVFEGWAETYTLENDK